MLPASSALGTARDMLHPVWQLAKKRNGSWLKSETAYLMPYGIALPPQLALA
jgi:hypothetical protein